MLFKSIKVSNEELLRSELDRTIRYVPLANSESLYLFIFFLARGTSSLNKVDTNTNTNKIIFFKKLISYNLVYNTYNI